MSRSGSQSLGERPNLTLAFLLVPFSISITLVPQVLAVFAEEVILLPHLLLIFFICHDFLHLP